MTLNIATLGSRLHTPKPFPNHNRCVCTHSAGRYLAERTLGTTGSGPSLYRFSVQTFKMSERSLFFLAANWEAWVGVSSDVLWYALLLDFCFVLFSD